MITQNQDTNAHAGQYLSFPDHALLVTSIFSTIQGEGPFAGTPATFIRLAGCNRGRKIGMGCSFCDTNFKINEGTLMTFDYIERQVEKLASTPLLVITGGEPFLQKNVVGFLKRVLSAGLHGIKNIQIESNGDCGPEELLTLNQDINASKIGFTIVISPKAEKTFRPTHKNLKDMPSVFKFLISGDESSPYFDIPYDYLGTYNPLPRVYLSPLTSYNRPVSPGEIADAWTPGLINVEETRRNYKRAIKLCFEYNFQLSLQTHLFLGVE